MSIWFFGDSFAVHSPYDPWSWIESIRTSIGINIHTTAVAGSALEWTYQRVEECRALIQPGDVMIACLTGFDRRWFFPDLPEYSGICNMESPRAIERLSAEERKAVLAYYQYLDNGILPRLQLLNWVDSVDGFVAGRNVRCLLIPAFPEPAALIQQHPGRWKNIDFHDGNLFSVSLNEWQTPGVIGSSDCRVNHLTRDNHQVLASKITAWIMHGSAMTSDGFHSGIITPAAEAKAGWESILLA